MLHTKYAKDRPVTRGGPTPLRCNAHLTEGNWLEVKGVVSPPENLILKLIHFNYRSLHHFQTHPGAPHLKSNDTHKHTEGSDSETLDSPFPWRAEGPAINAATRRVHFNHGLTEDLCPERRTGGGGNRRFAAF